MRTSALTQVSNVVSFNAYKRAQKLIEISESCERPFHEESNVYGTKEEGSFCALCDVRVKIVEHPSLGSEHKWYG